MKRILIGLIVALLATATVAASAAAQPSPTKKTWICHFTGKKYVAVLVGKKALKAHSTAHHGDIVTGVPQTKARAQRFCSTQQVLTPVKGGRRVEAALASTAPSLRGTLSLRLRLGQGDLCFQLLVSGAQGTSITVTAVTLAASAKTITLDLSRVSSTTGPSPVTLSACMPLSRATVKQLLQNAAQFTVTVNTSQGTLTGKLG